MKKITAIVLLLTACFSLFACSDNLSDKYAEQQVEGIVTDEEILQTLVSVCECIGYTDEIVCFEEWDDVSESYSKILLDYLSSKYYEKYSANNELFASLAEHYPTLSVNTVIPEADYENSVYRCFGGYRRVEHVTLPEYSYLPKINAYLAIGEKYSERVECTAVFCEETKDTYRFRARYENRGEYLIVLVKRDEGEPYIISVSKCSQSTNPPSTEST